MNSSIFDELGGYVAEMHAAIVRSRWIFWALMVGWLLFPFVVQTLIHPLDLVKLGYVLHGLDKPHTATFRQLSVAVLEMLLLLFGLCLWQLVLTVVFYRRAQIFGRAVATPSLWPLAVLLPAGLGNILWFIGLGYVDLSFAVGLASAVITSVIELLCEQLGRDFVAGIPTGFHPPA